MSNKKNTKISINTFDKILKTTYSNEEIIRWNDIDITINKTLSFKDVLSFVDSVSKSCFTDDNGTYLPEVKDFAIKCCILERYANFSLPQNIEHKYQLIYCTDAVDVVIKYINKTQLEEIISAINDKVDNIAQANIEAINRQMNELYSTFGNLEKQITEMFSGINKDDMTKLVGAISNSNLDEEKLVKAYIENKPSNNGETDGND